MRYQAAKQIKATLASAFINSTNELSEMIFARPVNGFNFPKFGAKLPAVNDHPPISRGLTNAVMIKIPINGANVITKSLIIAA